MPAVVERREGFAFNATATTQAMPAVFERREGFASRLKGIQSGFACQAGRGQSRRRTMP